MLWRISEYAFWSDGRVRNQIRGEMAVECRERCRVGGRESQADMAIGADQDDAARSEAGAHGSDIGIVRDLHHRDPALDRAAERREMGFQDSLGLVLREAAQELAAAVQAFEGRGAKLGQVSAVQASAPDVLSYLEERRKQTDGIQDLKGARLDRRGTRLSVPPDLPLDQPHPYSVAGEFAGSEQPRRSGAHNQDVVLRHQLRIL